MTTRPGQGSDYNIKMAETSAEIWWDGSSSSGSIEEETSSESSGYYLDLGTESPCSSPPNLFETSEFVEQWAAAGIAVPRLVRRPSWRRFNAAGKDRERSKASTKDAVDRDCGICFEYAVVPCRTFCCGKIFCTEHLEDWLHGPNAEGRCPNCENACSLDGGTLSLATPSLAPPNSQPLKDRRNTLKPGIYSSSPLSALQPHPNDTLQKDRSSLLGSPPAAADWNSVTPMPSSKRTALKISSDSTSTSTSTAESVVTSTSSDTEAAAAATSTRSHSTKRSVSVDDITPSLSTTPFATSWGAMSRLMSIVTFLMFIYKLLS